jgi:RNA polymerase sigma-70 factor (ECF subfamily)
MADPTNHYWRKDTSNFAQRRMEVGMHSRAEQEFSSMATIALEMNPEAVAVECHHRKVQELTEVITRHSPRFHRIALRHLGNVADAEDAVQDALLSALRHVNQFREQAQMATWLTTIVINAARMKLRRRLLLAQIPLDETGQQNLLSAKSISDPRPNPEQTCQKRELTERLAHATTQLSPVLRRTFQMRGLDGLSIRETAHLLGVPDGTVKARLARARTRLKTMIEKGSRGNPKRSRSTEAQVAIRRKRAQSSY